MYEKYVCGGIELFKDLKLNRDHLEQVIKKYAEGKYSTYSLNKTVKSPVLTRYDLVFDDKKLFIDFHFNNKGGTTIQVNNGQEQEEKQIIAEFISKHPLCLMADKEENNRSMLFKDICDENFNSIINLVKEDIENCSSILSEERTETKDVIKFLGKWSDKVTVTYTKSTKNVRIQGRPLLLFNVIASYFNEVVEVEKVIETLEENFQQNVNKATVEDQFKMYLPNSHSKHTDKLKKSLLKAVYNLNVTSQEYTCTDLTFEVLRALEGHVKITLLNDYGVECPNKYGTLSMFRFDETTDTATLLDPVRTTVNDAKKIVYYEKAYKHIVVYRHKIFHWDYPNTFGVDETIQIDNIEDAKRIIVDILSLIDEYYVV